MSAGRDHEKVKDTKKLIKLALDDGWTEAEIARKCRVAGDKVSAWKNGKARGQRHELKPLLDAFGWRLRRGKMRVYLVLDPKGGPPWDETSEGRKMLAALAELQALELKLADTLAEMDAADVAPSEADPREYVAQELAQVDARITMAQGALQRTTSAPDPDDDPFNVLRHDAEVVRHSRAEFERAQSRRSALSRLATLSDAEVADLRRRAELHSELRGPTVDDIRASHDEVHCTKLVMVPGRVVFTHGFTIPTRVPGRHERLLRFPVARWRVHHDSESQRFFLVREKRRRLSPPRLHHWGNLLGRVLGRPGPVDPRQMVGDLIPMFVDSPDDAARWLAVVGPPMDLDELLVHVEHCIREREAPHNPNDEVTLPFLLRKALIEQGFDVPGVAFHGSD